MKSEVHHALFVITLLVVLFLLEKVQSEGMLYKSVLAGSGFTVTNYYDISTTVTVHKKWMCGVKCSITLCNAWTWEEDTGTCTHYDTEFLNIGIPVKKTALDLQTFIPLSTEKKFFIFTGRDDTLTWDSAQAQCQALGENLIHIEDSEDLEQATDVYGQLYLGVHQPGQGFGPYTDLNGNEVTILPWWSHRTVDEYGPEHCLMYWKASGYDDIPCDSRGNPYFPTALICTYTKPV